MAAESGETPRHSLSGSASLSGREELMRVVTIALCCLVAAGAVMASERTYHPLPPLELAAFEAIPVDPDCPEPLRGFDLQTANRGNSASTRGPNPFVLSWRQLTPSAQATSFQRRWELQAISGDSSSFRLRSGKSIYVLSKRDLKPFGYSPPAEPLVRMTGGIPKTLDSVARALESRCSVQIIVGLGHVMIAPSTP